MFRLLKEISKPLASFGASKIDALFNVGRTSLTCLHVVRLSQAQVQSFALCVLSWQQTHAVMDPSPALTKGRDEHILSLLSHRS